MISYEKRTLTPDTVEQLIDLSRAWAEEDCCYGIVENTREDLCEPLFVAAEGNRIVGYIFGHFYTQEKKTSCIDSGCRCFAVDELYVLPEYRGCGIGGRLFRMLEEKTAPDCNYMTLTTSTKHYKGILKLYIEELDMHFHSAFLFKPTKPQED